MDYRPSQYQINPNNLNYNNYSNQGRYDNGPQNYYSNPYRLGGSILNQPGAYTYNFHSQNQNKYSNNYGQEIKKGTNQNNSLENKSFIDGFDNNNSALLNQEKSYARNIKGRLFNQQDPVLEKVKQDKQSSYRDQLQRQIEQIRQRKKQQKEKIEKEQMERERKFYEEFKIQAQVKQNKGDKKQENGYLMIRTLPKFKKGKGEILDNTKKQSLPQIIPNPPPKGRGKTYLNKSSLDQWAQEGNQNQSRISKQASQPNSSPPKSRLTLIQQQIIKQRSYEQQRLSKLLLFQQRVLQKITDIKTEIKKTALDLDNDKQVLRIRNNLRAKPIPFDQQFERNTLKKSIDMNNFYSLPKRQPKIPTAYSLKLRDMSQRMEQKNVKIDEVNLNDKNIERKMKSNQNEQVDE